MRLTPTELDRLTIFTAAELARRRRAKGWRLTHPEALALICDEMHEAARGGGAYAEVVRVGQTTLTEDDILEGVARSLRRWAHEHAAHIDAARERYDRANR